MKPFKRILSSITIAIISVIVVVIFFKFWDVVIASFDYSASYLYGSSADNRGKLLTVILTSIGGLGALWGLYLNNKKVNQQIRQVNELVRQNDIAVQNSNDKRFGEAIGYLNNENEGIAIGGVYALYQLAKEDSRYTPIITNIFYNYVNDNTDKQNKKSYQTILSLLFSKDNPFVFDGEVQYRGIVFSDINMYIVAKIKFISCEFRNTNIKGVREIFLYDCIINDSIFADFNNLSAFGGKFSHWTIISREKSFIYIIADELYYSDILVKTISLLNLEVKSLNDVNVFSDYIYDLQLRNILKKYDLSTLEIHYVSRIEKQEIRDSSLLENGSVKLIKDSAMRSDYYFRKKAGFNEDIN